MTDAVSALAFEDVVGLLERLATIEGLVLVGGQAVDFWCARYATRSKALGGGGPYTSADVDLMGSPALVEQVARALGGRFRLPDPFDPTPSAGIVRYRDAAGVERTLDVLREVHGIASKRVRDSAIEVELRGDDRRFRFRVLHPVLCLESRVKNFVGLPGYDGPHSKRQLAAATICVLELVRDLVDAGRTRESLRIFERVFRTADSPAADAVARRADVEIFDAVAPLEGLPAAFRERRYPRMRARIEARRRRALGPR